jgi:peptidoglycan/xylan/chitin deacetylase (PgdA/CDA1 family)
MCRFEKFILAHFFYFYIYHMSYWVKSKWWMKWLFPEHVWKIDTMEKKVFLTFDDGPTPEITYWVLKQLKIHNAKATFFCIGDNIQKHPILFKEIITENHSVGNHTFNHLNGWKTSNDVYFSNVELCQKEYEVRRSRKWEEVGSGKKSEVGSGKEVGSLGMNTEHWALNTEHSKLFRPPFGKIKPSQSRKLRKLGYKIIMWDIISFDFDQSVSKEKCLKNVLKNIENGSIIVFHDSKKGWKNLEYVLPKTLQFLNENGYSCEKLA